MPVKCPKCSTEMIKSSLLSSVVVKGVWIRKEGDFIGDSIIPLYCPNCGYIELYESKFFKD